MRFTSDSFWALLGALAVLLALITFSGCQRSLPEIKATMLLEFGKFLPPEREHFLIENAGNLYALGMRKKSQGPYRVQSYPDQFYSVKHNLALDLYIPTGVDKPLPVVLLVHGGGWQYFSKVAPSGFARILASHGYAAVSVDYRASSQAKWPAQLEDLQTALKWLEDHAGFFGLDMQRTAYLGDSAGGHLSAMLALTAAQNGLTPPSAAVGYYGVYDLTTLVARNAEDAEKNPINQLLGVPADEAEAVARSASPLFYVNENAPPFLLIHGTDDSLVPIEQTERMAARLQDSGVEVETLYVEKADHLLLEVLDTPAPSLNEVDTVVISFLSRHLQAGKESTSQDSQL